MGTKQNRIQNCKKISYFYVDILTLVRPCATFVDFANISV